MPLQHRPAAQQLGLPPTRTRSGDTAIAGLRFRFAPPPTGNGGGDDNALTNNPDHPVGAAQTATLTAIPRLKLPMAAPRAEPSATLNTKATIGRLMLSISRLCLALTWHGLAKALS